MAKTVDTAFKEFMKDIVNLDSEKVKKARGSRDFLKNKISSFSNFFPLYSVKNIDYGSFARKTKIRDLDDIDMIFTLSANGCTWSEEYDGTIYITTPEDSEDYKNFRHSDSLRLNSIKVINKFTSLLKTIPHYSKAEIHRNKHSTTFKLDSYEWNFDIVPAFITTEDTLGQSFYIIPDGYGNWMKTDPRIDKDRVTTINQNNSGKILDVIRAIKYWQRRSTMPSMSSYLLENLILEYYELNKATNYIDYDIKNIFYYLSFRVHQSVNDPKKIQGDINTLSYADRMKISIKSKDDYLIALNAISLEIDEQDPEKSIREWQKIFGKSFPAYG